MTFVASLVSEEEEEDSTEMREIDSDRHARLRYTEVEEVEEGGGGGGGGGGGVSI